MYKTSSKQGSFQITDDGYVQIVPMLSKQPLWREAISSIKAISVQKGIVFCAIAIHCSVDRYVESLSKVDIDRIRATLPTVQFNEVKTLPSQVIQGQPGSLQLAQEMETTVKTYENTKHYQRDQQAMSRQGWSVQNTSSHIQRHMFSKATDQIVVTYQRVKR